MTEPADPSVAGGRADGDDVLADDLARIESLPLPDRAAEYGELHEHLGRALDEDD